MPKTATTHARMDPEIKQEAEQIIKRMGLSISAAHDLFYRQIIAHQGMPFELRIPNRDTRQAMDEAKNGIGAKYDSVQDLFNEL